MSLLSELPDFIREQDWEDFCEHRREIKKPMSKVAEKRMLRKLTRLHNAGQDVSYLIEQSIINGWQDVYERDLREAGDDLANRYIAEGIAAEAQDG